MHEEEYPYPECATCKSLTDCKHPDVQMDNMGTPLPPDCCPHPIDTMRETMKKRKKKKDGLS